VKTAHLAVLAAGLVALQGASEPAGPAGQQSAPVDETKLVETAIFAGGCFWCMEPPFEKLPGVREVVSGYTGGAKLNPTYEEVSAGTTGHAEVVQVTFDPREVSYQTLLDVFWRNIDPVDARGQFCDKGSQYRPAIFPRGPAQQELAEKSLAGFASSGRFKEAIAVQIAPASVFYPAEDYHQDYARKNPIRYRFYRSSCGRDARLEEVWGTEAGGH